MPQRVFLHVGSPKTGSSFLQHVLWSGRHLALEQGLLLPGDALGHYLACLDVRGEHALGARIPGAWRVLVDQAMNWGGDVLISHELFAPASQEQARRAIADLGARTEVHVVVTARDLARQIPAHWQENVKGLVRQVDNHRATSTETRTDQPFPEFMDGLRADRSGTNWFWSVQDFADVLDRWGGGLPREHVHVVTLPPRGAPPPVLWERFAGLLGLDPSSFDTRLARKNESLGAEQVELLRRMNAVLGDRLAHHGPYSRMVKGYFANQVLAGQQGSRLALTGADHAFAVRRSEAIVKRLRTAGVDVVGDLAELVPSAVDAGGTCARDTPEDGRVLDSSVDALITILDRVYQENQQHRDTVADLRRELQRAHRSKAALGAGARIRPRGRWPVPLRRGMLP